MPKGQYRYWMFTWNNPPEDWRGAIQTFGATYASGQLEKGDLGTVHIQGALYFVDAIGSRYFEDFACWTKGIPKEEFKRVVNYSKKRETRVDGPYECGHLPERKKRDFGTALKLAKEGRTEEIEPDMLIPYYATFKKISFDAHKPYERQDVCGYWIYGDPGVGKSHYVRTLHPGLYIKSQSKWFDGYVGQETILIDDFDEGGRCLGHYIKIWTDKWACSGEVKCGTVALRHTAFYITSNFKISDIWDGKLLEAILRRFKQYHMVSRDQLILLEDSIYSKFK